MRSVTLAVALLACQSANDGAPTDGDDDPTDSAPEDTDAGDTDTDVDPPDDEFCDFTQCGGDVVGSWTILGACADFPIYYNLPCPSATTQLDIVSAGSIAFDAASTYAINATAAYSLTSTFPAACNGEITDCEDWDYYDTPQTECTGDVAVACVCVTTLPPAPAIDSGSWMYTGEDVTLVSDFASTPKGSPITVRWATCLEGDQLKLEQVEPFVIRYTLER